MPLTEAAVWLGGSPTRRLLVPGCTKATTVAMISYRHGEQDFFFSATSTSFHFLQLMYSRLNFLCNGRSFLEKLQLHVEAILCSLGFYQCRQASHLSLHKFLPELESGGVLNKVVSLIGYLPCSHAQPSPLGLPRKQNFPPLLHCTVPNTITNRS